MNGYIRGYATRHKLTLLQHTGFGMQLYVTWFLVVNLICKQSTSKKERVVISKNKYYTCIGRWRKRFPLPFLSAC